MDGYGSSSFGRRVSSAIDGLTSFPQAAIRAVGDQVQALQTKDGQMMLFFTVVLPLALYVLLSPGLILTWPAPNYDQCRKLVPVLDNVTHEDVCAEGDITAQYTGICAAHKKCQKAWGSGYTGINSVFVHAFVFLLLLGSINMARMYMY